MRLGDIAKEHKETFKGDKKDIPLVGLEHLIGGELRFTKYDINTDNTFTKVFRKGDILFGRRRAYLKKAAIAEFSGICSGDITVIEAIDGKVDPKLLPFIIQNDALFDFAVSRSAGGLSPRVKWEHLANYEFELPSIDEQRVLADKLWAAYNLKEAYKKMIDATDEMVKSQFIEMFKGEKNVRLETLLKGKSSKAKTCFTANHEIEYIDISSVDNKTNAIITTNRYLFANAPSRAQQITNKGDILVSTVRPNLRNIAIVQLDNNNLISSTGFCVLRPKTGYENYLKCIVLSDEFTSEMMDKSTGTSYPAVNDNIVLDYLIQDPSRNELTQISNIVEQADKSKFELTQAIDKIDKVIKSLLQ